MSIFSLTRKADYGLMMLTELAQKGKGGLVSIKKLSETRGLPRAFLAQIGQDLVRADIVGSKEGRNGGYFLKNEPENVDVRSALVAVGGGVEPTVCVTKKGDCPIETVCGQRHFMMGLTAEMEGLLSKYSLADLVNNRE